jgi:hypothetical protein
MANLECCIAMLEQTPDQFKIDSLTRDDFWRLVVECEARDAESVLVVLQQKFYAHIEPMSPAEVACFCNVTAFSPETHEKIKGILLQ